MKLNNSGVKRFLGSLQTKDENSKKRKSKHSLKWNVCLGFLIFSVLMIIILWLFQTVFLYSFYKAIKTKNITSCAQSIEQNIDDSDISSFVKTISDRNDTCILLYRINKNGDYRYVCSSYANSVCTIHNLTTKDLDTYYDEAAANGGMFISIDYTDDEYAKSTHSSDNDSVFEKSKSQSLMYVSIISNSEDNEYMLLLNSIITPVNSTVETLRVQLVIISITFLVLCLFFSIVSSKILASPIENITKSAKELAEGNYDVKFNGSGYKEVEELSETLNYAAEELSQVDQMRKDLIANVSHDLRTPLTLITGYGEIMRDIPGENVPENVQIIIDEATRLKNLVNDLIDISKIEAGTMKIGASVFCITDSIKEMFGRYNKLKEQDGFIFEFDYDCDVYVYADQLKISQVIYNLVNNAVNYSGDSKLITVRQICYDNRVRIEVVDRGPGIPSDKLKNIWDRYYKVDKSHKSAKIGTGLGLSIVKSVLKLHRAQFGVFSTMGKGSTFWFEMYRTDKNGEPL